MTGTITQHCALVRLKTGHLQVLENSFHQFVVQTTTWTRACGTTRSFLEKHLMKPLVSAIIVASALATPALSSAQQTNGPLTRAEVRAQLVTAEQEGMLHQSKSQYPKTAPASSRTATAFDISGYGPTASGSSQTVTPEVGPKPSLFSHH